MDQLFHLRDSILGYISPAKYRRRTLLPTTPSNKFPTASRPLRSDMCFTEPKDEKTRAVIAGRVSKKYLSPNDTKGQRPKPKKRESGSSLYKYEGGSDASDELTDHTPRSQSPEPSQVLLAQSQVILDTVEVDEVDIDDTISVEDKVNQFLDNQREVHETQVVDDQEGWHEAERALFTELRMRGLQPLLPAHWRSDFRTCPPALFSFNMNDTFLNAASGNEFRGMPPLKFCMYQTDKIQARTLSCHSSPSAAASAASWPARAAAKKLLKRRSRTTSSGPSTTAAISTRASSPSLPLLSASPAKI